MKGALKKVKHKTQISSSDDLENDEEDTDDADDEAESSQTDSDGILCI